MPGSHNLALTAIGAVVLGVSLAAGGGATPAGSNAVMPAAGMKYDPAPVDPDPNMSNTPNALIAPVAPILQNPLAPVAPILQNPLAPLAPILQNPLAPVAPILQNPLAPVAPILQNPLAPLAPILQKVSANTAPQDVIAAALQAVGVASPKRWAAEVVEYRPYPMGDPNLAKLRQNLAKYNPAPQTVDQIVSVLLP